MDKDFGLIDKIIDGIMQSDEWNKALLDNERMKQEEKKLAEILDKITECMGQDVAEQVEEAANNFAFAATDCSVLFGLHVADVLRRFSSCPAAYANCQVKKLKLT